MLLLLTWWIIAGIMAEKTQVEYHQLINSSVCLNVRHSAQFHNAKWTFAGKVTIVSGSKINPHYTKKVDYSPGSSSLCLKKLTVEDAGNYEVSFDKDFTPVSEEHKVIIQDMVPRPVLSVHQSNLSAGLCSLTVNCSIQDDWAVSVCDKEGCRTSRTSFNMFNITIFTDERIVCRGNNHVSTNSESESIPACFTETRTEHQEELIYIVGAVVVSLCACITTLAILIYCRRKVPRVIRNQPGETASQTEPRVSAASSSQAEPSYENADVAQLGSLESLGKRDIDTVYCLVQAPGGEVTVPPTG